MAAVNAVAPEMAAAAAGVFECAYCSAPYSEASPLLRCSGCDTVWYCGQQHQEFHWKQHKPLCRLIGSQKKAKAQEKEARQAKRTQEQVSPPSFYTYFRSGSVSLDA